LKRRAFVSIIILLVFLFSIAATAIMLALRS